MTTKTKVYRFKATGGFNINRKFKAGLSYNGEDICRFTLPDGRTVRLAIALEVESKDGNNFKYITSESEMTELGFECLDYDSLTFEEC